MPEDQRDFEGFVEGLAFLAQLSINEMMEHFRAHKEDAWSNLRHASGQGNMPCTKKGMDHLRALVFRRTRAVDGAKNLDHEEVLHEVQETICKMLTEGSREGQNEDEILNAVLSTALERAGKRQKSTTYHYSCVLTGAKDPSEFTLGPVKFTLASLFNSWLDSLDSTKIKIGERVRNAEFFNYTQQFGWVVSVKVPACSAAISKARAELAGRTAINFVRVWFGLGHGRRMRLVHTEPATSGFSNYLVEKEGSISLSWSRTMEGAAVVGGWFKQVHIEHQKLVSWFLRDIVYDERTEVTERLIDALSWFGDAAFEPSPGAKIAKLVMLLERLTGTTKKFSKKRFCARVAIMASTSDTDIEAKYWEAYEFYNARGYITHGSSSQSSDEHWAALRNAQGLITNSIFRALEIYSVFRFNLKRPASLRSFFDQQDNLWSHITRPLEAELAARDKSRGF